MRCLLCDFFLQVRKSGSNSKDYGDNTFHFSELPAGNKKLGSLDSFPFIFIMTFLWREGSAVSSALSVQNYFKKGSHKFLEGQQVV